MPDPIIVSYKDPKTGQTLYLAQPDFQQKNLYAPDYIRNKPGAAAGGGGTQVNADWNATSGPANILNKPNITNPVQSDWNATSGPSAILNKPGVFTLATSMPTAYSLGILSGPVDQTIALNSALANPNYAGLVIDYSIPGPITISGLVNCNGKRIFFQPGSYFTGSGTLNNAVLAGSYRSKFFDTSITLTNCSSATDVFSAMWYGATGNGSTNDQPSLQMASDMVIANPALPRDLYMPVGSYKITSTWNIYKWDGTNYAQYIINIIGAKKAANSNLNGVPRIIATSIVDAPAIAVQRATSGSIFGLSVEGPMTYDAPNYETFVTTTYASVKGSVRDSRYSPSAGICIDAYCNTTSLPADGGYPTLTSWYRGTGVNSGTTDFLISDCTIHGFTVDVCNSPNGQTQQGEDCIIQNCRLEFCNVAVAYCQTQSDNCYIKNCRSWASVWTVMDTFQYGNGQGQPANIEGYNVAGKINTLFNCSANKGYSIKDFYAESFFQIGVLSSIAAGVTVIDGTFDFGVSVITPQYHGQFTNVSFLGSRFRYYDDLFNKRMRLYQPRNTTFDTCYFDLPPYTIGQSGSQYNPATYRNCKSSTNQFIGLSNNMYNLPGGNELVLFGEFTIQDGSGLDSSASGGYAINPQMSYNYNSASFDRSYTNIATATVTPDGSRSASFTSANTAMLRVNDIVIDHATGDVLGRISSIVSTTVTISEIPINITTASYVMDSVYYLTASNAMVGDISSGSPNITNVSPLFAVSGTNAMSAGFRFDHAAFPRGTYIVSYNSGTRVMVMSNNSNKTATRQNFVNGDPVINAKSILSPASATLNSYALAFAGGTIWTELASSSSTSTSTPNKWVFNRGGYLSATTLGLASGYQADFNYQPVISIVSGVMKYFDNTTNTWVTI